MWSIASVLTLSSCGAFGEGLLAGLGSYGSYDGYVSPSYGSGSMNYLLDPNYAAAQVMAQQNQYNQVQNSLITQTISQVNSQEEQEYQEFCKYNKKSDGTNYSKTEWRALKGQALQNSQANSTSSAVSSSNAKGSYSSSRKRCRKLSSSDLAHCNGTGVCSRCNGKKKYFDTSFGVDHWVDPCVICNGTGKCPSCNGTGYRSL